MCFVHNKNKYRMYSWIFDREIIKNHNLKFRFNALRLGYRNDQIVNRT